MADATEEDARASQPAMKLLAAAAMALGLLAMPVEQVAACSCAMFGPEEAAQAADAVFAGTVVGDRSLGSDVGRPFAATVPFPEQFGQRMYTFSVDGVAKGDVPSVVDVLAGGDGASCGMTFGMDERWLIFTTFDGAVHTTGLCSGNTPLEAGADAPLPLTAPTEAGPDPEPAGIPLPALALLGVVAAVLAVSWLAFRRDRPS
ncbi:MAG TPA: hypothetical protein VF364_11490 [Candidatus Limnocylindria bacterium]